MMILFLLRKKHLNQLKNIETLYKIFSKFGRNLVFKEDLKILYEIKFCLLASLIYEENINIIDNVTYTEYEFYQDIVFRKIEKIVKGTNKDIQTIANLNNKSEMEIIKIIINILKMGKNEFSAWNILNNRVILSFLLSFDYDYGFKYFFLRFKNPKNTYINVNYYDKLFKWEDMLPLDTIYRIIKINLVTDGDEGFRFEDSLYEFYLLVEDMINNGKSDRYELFNGLTYIDVHDILDDSNEKKALDVIKKHAKNKKIYIPNTLKVIHGQLFWDMTIYFKKDSFRYETIVNEKELMLPNDVSFISWEFLSFDNIKKIVIENYDDFKAKEQVFRTIAEHYIIEKTTRCRYYTPSIEVKKKQKMYMDGRYSSSSNSFLFDRDCTFTTFILKPSIDYLILYSANCETLYLDKRDLSLEVERKTECFADC